MLNNYEEQVKEILMKYPETRGSDGKLYSIYLKKNMVGTPNVFLFFDNFASYGVAQMETVSRCRRKLQAKYPDLQADELVKNRRKEAQITFIDWSKL